jgi:predicted nucleic acid-binding protein
VRIYLDVSCLNRLFDDQSQPRIRLESAAVSVILEIVDSGAWEHVTSRMAVLEVAAIPDPVRRGRVMLLLPKVVHEVTPVMLRRAEVLIAAGLGAADAVHVAAAEGLGIDVVLSCDDRLIRRCRAMQARCKVRVENPIHWIEEQNHDPNA